jgi:polyisoprenyl-phosphate glycosyltransferase
VASRHIEILVPVLNEQDNIPIFIQRLENIVKHLPESFTLIFIDDGSKDRTWSVISQSKSIYFKIRGIRLLRNFGKEMALMAGVQSSLGADAAITCDADLQHPIDLIPKMIDLWKKEEVLIVDGIKDDRGQENYLYKLSTSIFYSVFKLLSGFSIKNSTDFKLLDRRVIDLLNDFPERNLLFRGVTEWLGAPTAQLPFKVADRTSGRSQITLAKRFKLAKSAITSFSVNPLRLVTSLSFLFLFGALILIAQSLYLKFTDQAVEGFTTVIILLLIIGWILLLSLGVIGEYLAQVYEEAKQRPRYVIYKEINTPKGGAIN